MDDDKLLEITQSMEEKLGKENFALVSDDIGLLMTGNSENLKKIEDQTNKISILEDKNEKLVAANGNLLQHVPMGKSEEKQPEKVEESSKKISLKDAFDSKGNFIH